LNAKGQDHNAEGRAMFRRVRSEHRAASRA